MASGLSSSAAIEVVTAIALDALLATGIGREQIASMAHRAENDFVGVRCGIMDQYASALGEPGHVLWLHCQGPRWEHVPFDPEACEVLVMDTKKPRKLAASGFNERVAQCAAAYEILCEHAGKQPNLAAFSESQLRSCRAALDDVLYSRARHVVTEMGRIAAGVEALRAHDYALLGAQLTASGAARRAQGAGYSHSSYGGTGATHGGVGGGEKCEPLPFGLCVWTTGLGTHPITSRLQAAAGQQHASTGGLLTAQGRAGRRPCRRAPDHGARGRGRPVLGRHRVGRGARCEVARGFGRGPRIGRVL